MMFEQGLTRDGEHKHLVLTTILYNNESTVLIYMMWTGMCSEMQQST